MEEAMRTSFFRTAAMMATIIMGAAACATPHSGQADMDLDWAAHGYLSPGRTDDPEIIGAYASKRECLDAVDAWMSRQVVGNPVSGECLPVDRR